jgi:hypothetical protein
LEEEEEGHSGGERRTNEETEKGGNLMLLHYLSWAVITSHHITSLYILEYLSFEYLFRANTKRTMGIRFLLCAPQKTKSTRQKICRGGPRQKNTGQQQAR